MDEILVDLHPMGEWSAFELEYDVYRQEGYIPENPFRRVLENDNYPEFVHFVARHKEETIGSLRLVTDPEPRHGVFKLGSFAHFSLFDWAADLLRKVEAKHVFEVGTMVIQPGFRGGKTYSLLFQKAFEYAVLQRVQYSIATIDEEFYHRLRQRGLPFRAIGETRFYMGSNTVPAILDVKELERMFLGANHAKPAKTCVSKQSAIAS